MIILNPLLHKGEFIVFDLDKPKDGSLTIQLRFDTAEGDRDKTEAQGKKCSG